MAPDGLIVEELAEVGVAHISVGPKLQYRARRMFQTEAENLFSQVA